LSFQDTTNVVIFLALPEEHDEFLVAFPPTSDHSDNLHVISEHENPIDGYRVFSVLSIDMGDAESLHATEKAIQKLGADLVICVGIAGSLSKDLKIGDVAVANEIIDISQNIKILERKIASRRRGRKGGDSRTRTEQIIELSPKSLPVDNLLSASFRFVRSHPHLRKFHNDWVLAASKRRTELIGSKSPGALAEELEIPQSVEIGPIISGPVVASGAFKKTLKSIDRKILAVETESAGIFRACARASVPCITVRGISDHADIDKNALERTTKSAARLLATQNAIAYLTIQLSNPKFMAIADAHRTNEQASGNECEPEILLSTTESTLDSYLERMSPEYKHRPNNTKLPIPRIKNESIEENLDDATIHHPKVFVDALASNSRIYVKVPKSFPNQTLAWSVAQALIKGEMDGKQILPIAVSGEEIFPPNKGVAHSVGYDPADHKVLGNFTPVIILNEPPSIHGHG
jgi:nucleoside phosphorylase